MKHILLLEDDKALGRGVCLALKSGEVEVTLCDTLAQGRQVFQQAPFDLLILYVNLPDGSGLDLLRRLRDHVKAHHEERRNHGHGQYTIHSLAEQRLYVGYIAFKKGRGNQYQADCKYYSRQCLLHPGSKLDSDIIYHCQHDCRCDAGYDKGNVDIHTRHSICISLIQGRYHITQNTWQRACLKSHNPKIA